MFHFAKGCIPSCLKSCLVVTNRFFIYYSTYCHTGGNWEPILYKYQLGASSIYRVPIQKLTCRSSYLRYVLGRYSPPIHCDLNTPFFLQIHPIAYAYKGKMGYFGNHATSASKMACIGYCPTILY